MAAARKLRGAVVGFGQVAEKAHAPIFVGHPEFEIVAVADEFAPRLSAARAVFPQAGLYPSLEELLRKEPDLDFVDIATPPFLHGKQALAALQRGLHVLCEKPLTVDVKEFDLIGRAAAETGCVAYTIHNWAYSPQWLKILELARSGAIGEIRHAELHALRSAPAAGAAANAWRTDPSLSGGGILIDHGWHNLYLLFRLLSSGGAAPDPSACRASSRLHFPGGGAPEDEAAVFVDLGTATGLIYLSWKAPERSNRALVHGSRGFLELGDDRVLLRSNGLEQKFLFPEKLSAGSAHPEWFSAMLPDFQNELSDPRGARNLKEAEFCLKVIRRICGSSPGPRNRPARAALSPR